MNETEKINDSELIISHNKEEWDRFSFILMDPEPNVIWINCDTTRLKKPFHDTITEQFPQFVPYDIYINEKTESLNRIILWEDKDKIPANAIIHVFGLEDAIKNKDFLANLNFERDSTFRDIPAPVIFWADFATGTVLTRKTFDFWSWVFFSFDFKTPDELLTARQKGFQDELKLEDVKIRIPSKDGTARIRHLENEWEEFLRSVNGKPSSVKQMKDAIAIVRTLTLEYNDDGRYMESIKVLESLLKIIPDLSVFEIAKVCVYLSESYWKLEKLEKAKDLLEKAYDVFSKEYGENIEVIDIGANLGIIYRALGDLSKAKELLSKELMYYSKNGIDDTSPVVSKCQSNLALVYADLGELNTAKELLEKSLVIDIKNFGDTDPKVVNTLSNLASVYYDLNDFYKAKDLLENALKIEIQNYGENSSKNANLYNNLAYVYKDLNESSKAKLFMQKSYEICKLTLGENARKTTRSFAFLQSLEQK